VVERQQRRQRRELGVGCPSFAGLVGDVGEAKAVAGPLPKVRHDVLTVHGEIDGEILERLHLDDDQILSAGRPEARADAGARRRAPAQPGERVLYLGVGRRRPQPRRAQVVPGVVRVIAERPHLLDDRARAEHLIEPRRREDRRRRQERAGARDDADRHRCGQHAGEKRRPTRVVTCEPGDHPQGERPVHHQPDEIWRDERADRAPDAPGLVRREQRRGREQVPEEPVIHDVSEDHQRAEDRDREQHPRAHAPRQDQQSQHRHQYRDGEHAPVRDRRRLEHRGAGEDERLGRQRRGAPYDVGDRRERAAVTAATSA
jgi:hypothetical protein